MHLSESELAAMTHGGVSAISERVSTHLASCPDCARRLEALRADDREVAALLSGLDHPAPRVGSAAFLDDQHRRRRRIGSIAAGLALCAAGAAAALPNSPLHQVFLRALSKPRTASTSATVPVRGSGGAGAMVGIGFVPGRSLAIRFENPHAGGHLRIRLVDGSRVSATADGNASFSVHQSQLEVTDRGVPMTFTLEIPRSVSEVTIRAGDEILFEKRAGAVSSSRSMDSAGVYTFDFSSASSSRAPRAR